MMSWMVARSEGSLTNTRCSRYLASADTPARGVQSQSQANVRRIACAMTDLRLCQTLREALLAKALSVSMPGWRLRDQ